MRHATATVERAVVRPNGVIVVVTSMYFQHTVGRSGERVNKQRGVSSNGVQGGSRRAVLDPP